MFAIRNLFNSAISPYVQLDFIGQVNKGKTMYCTILNMLTLIPHFLVLKVATCRSRNLSHLSTSAFRIQFTKMEIYLFLLINHFSVEIEFFHNINIFQSWSYFYDLCLCSVLLFVAERILPNCTIYTYMYIGG